MTTGMHTNVRETRFTRNKDFPEPELEHCQFITTFLLGLYHRQSQPEKTKTSTTRHESTVYKMFACFLNALACHHTLAKILSVINQDLIKKVIYNKSVGWFESLRYKEICHQSKFGMWGISHNPGRSTEDPPRIFLRWAEQMRPQSNGHVLI